MFKRSISILLAVLLLRSFVFSASAHSVPDLTRKGTIRITMRHGDNLIPGGTMTIFRVGDLQESNGNYSFVLTEDFAESEISLDNLTSASLPEQLADYVIKQKMEGKTREIDENALVVFDDLELGLYLFVQQEAAEGYNLANPFIISVPSRENGEYIYTIDGSPKLDPITERPTEPTSPPTTEPIGPNLPQTGQLNWPVPILALAGLVLFVFGWVLCFGKKKDIHEA